MAFAGRQAGPRPTLAPPITQTAAAKNNSSVSVATQLAQAGPKTPAIDPAAANADAASCQTSSGDAAIAACDRAIASGRFTGPDLALLFDRRGI